MSDYLAVDVYCGEISKRPLFTHFIDLDKARDGRVLIEVSREDLARMSDTTTRC